MLGDDAPAGAFDLFAKINFALFFNVVLLVGAALFINYIIQKITRPPKDTLDDFQRLGKRSLQAFLIGFVIIFMPWENILPPPILDHVKKYIWVGEVLMPTVLALGVALVSIFYSSGEWYKFFTKFQSLGIVSASADRRGRQTERDDFWAKKIKGARDRVILSGATLGGWFSGSLWLVLKKDLPEILARVSEKDGFEIFVPDPTKDGFGVRAKDEQTAPGLDEKDNLPPDRLKIALARVENTLREIALLYDDSSFSSYIQNKKLRVYVYDGTPISVQCIDDAIFFVPYLPRVKDSECPEIEMRRGGDVADTIMSSISRLRDSARLITKKSELDEIVETLQDLNTTRPLDQGPRNES